MQLGEKAGLRQETISLIENGHAAAKLETLLAVLAAVSGPTAIALAACLTNLQMPIRH